MKRLLLGVAAAVFALAAQAADPVAFVADLRGNATIEGDGKVNFLAELSAGTRLLLGTGATVAVTYASTGAEFTLHGPGEYLVNPDEVKAEKGAPPSKRSVMSLASLGVVGRMSQTATASVRMRSVQRDVTKAALEFPVDTRVSTLQPMLRWRGAPSKDGATVTLVDAAGREVWKGSGQPQLVRPAVKLSPATRYTWTVMTSNGAIGEAQFETLAADALAKTARSRASAKNFSDRVVHALLLQDVGATQEAREAWAALARERPDLPELAVLAR